MSAALVTAGAAVCITALLCFTFLRAWRGWLELQRLAAARGSGTVEPEEEDVGLRIELAGVKERLKKLEAIASGVEL